MSKLKNAFADLFPQFARVPIAKRVDDDLYHARVELLNAQHNAEHWNAMVGMYSQRIARLEAQVDPDEVHCIEITGGVAINVSGAVKCSNS